MRKTPSIHIGILIAFLANTFGPISTAIAEPIYSVEGEFHLPAPGILVQLSPPLDPPMLKGIKVHSDNPFKFDFILDKGDGYNRHPEQSEGSQQEQLKQESTKLIKYFLASLTIPEKDLWVNLSPYEKDRIIPQSFGLTEMGRDLLAEDYMLKQITASLIYPEGEVGKRFWKRIYEESEKKFGTTNIPVNTFNKVWIVPEKAVVYENAQGGTAYVVESKLKVMLEQDYLSLEKHSVVSEKNPVIPSEAKDLKTPLDSSVTPQNDVNALGSQIVREIVIPELTKEVNEDKNFSQLRQVYNSLILATWYKKKIKDSILEQVYADKSKIKGTEYHDSVIAGQSSGVIASEAKQSQTELIYQRYLRAFKKGVYNYIKEEQDPVTQETIPRKYFSGGLVMDTAQIIDISSNTLFIKNIVKASALVLITAALSFFIPHAVRAQDITNIKRNITQMQYDTVTEKNYKEIIENAAYIKDIRQVQKAVNVAWEKGDDDIIAQNMDYLKKYEWSVLWHGKDVIDDLFYRGARIKHREEYQKRFEEVRSSIGKMGQKRFELLVKLFDLENERGLGIDEWESENWKRLCKYFQNNSLEDLESRARLLEAMYGDLVVFHDLKGGLDRFVDQAKTMEIIGKEKFDFFSKILTPDQEVVIDLSDDSHDQLSDSVSYKAWSDILTYVEITDIDKMKEYTDVFQTLLANPSHENMIRKRPDLFAKFLEPLVLTHKDRAPEQIEFYKRMLKKYKRAFDPFQDDKIALTQEDKIAIAGAVAGAVKNIQSLPSFQPPTKKLEEEEGDTKKFVDDWYSYYRDPKIENQLTERLLALLNLKQRAFPLNESGRMNALINSLFFTIGFDQNADSSGDLGYEALDNIRALNAIISHENGHHEPFGNVQNNRILCEWRADLDMQALIQLMEGPNKYFDDSKEDPFVQYTKLEQIEMDSVSKNNPVYHQDQHYFARLQMKYIMEILGNQVDWVTMLNALRTIEDDYNSKKLDKDILESIDQEGVSNMVPLMKELFRRYFKAKGMRQPLNYTIDEYKGSVPISTFAGIKIKGTIYEPNSKNKNSIWANGFITKEAFEKSLKDAQEDDWQKLIQDGYINAQGEIQAKAFAPETKATNKKTYDILQPFQKISSTEVRLRPNLHFNKDTIGKVIGKDNVDKFWIILQHAQKVHIFGREKKVSLLMGLVFNKQDMNSILVKDSFNKIMKNSSKKDLKDKAAEVANGRYKKKYIKTIKNKNGGIAFNDVNKILESQSHAGNAIKLHIDPAMLAQLQNAPGFTPVIINMQPLKSLQEFLGISTTPVSA